MKQDKAPDKKIKKEARKPKVPRKISASYLENSALYYLQRFSTSSENLRRVMMRKINKSCAHHETSVDEAAELLDIMIVRFLTSGLLDDTLYARARTNTLHRRGSSARQIRSKLMEKGLANDIIEQVIGELANEVENPELEAAISYARRRRLGPWRDPAKRDEKHEKDLAALARAGFSYDIARKVIGAESVQWLEDY